MPSGLEINLKNRVLEVKLNRPKVNAIDLDLSQALGEAFAELRDNNDLRVGIITGEGEKIFSAAIIRSQDNASSNPPPIAKPFSAHMTGLFKFQFSVSPAKPPSP